MPVLLDPPPRTNKAGTHRAAVNNLSPSSDQNRGQTLSSTDQDTASNVAQENLIYVEEVTTSTAGLSHLSQALPPPDETSTVKQSSTGKYPKLNLDPPVPSNCEKICTFQDPDAQVIMDMSLSSPL
jgi:hypothetical protein